MNRLLKPLAVALALVMVMVILPVSVKADAGQLTFANSPVTFNETTIDGTNYIVVDLNGNLMYNNQPLANSNVVIQSVTITGINQVLVFVQAYVFITQHTIRSPDLHVVDK